MINLSHFLGGYLQVSVEIPFPPRLLNLCSQEGIRFWGVVWQSGGEISFSIPRKEWRKLEALVARHGGTVFVEKSRGLPPFLGGFRHRIGFLVGMSLSLFAVSVLSQFIFVVEISGNDRVSTGEIRIALEEAGLDVGVYGKSLAISRLTQEALSKLEDISWMSVNLYGTRAVVTVLERTLPPEIIPREGLYDMVAVAGGIVEEINLHSGEAMVEVGETVVSGQVLISGNVELPPPIYSQNPSMWMTVVGSGRVWARTWREITAVIPMSAMVKEEGKGVTMNSYVWDFFGETHSFLHHSVLFPSYYEKSRQVYHIPTLEEIPFSWVHIQETPYQLREVELNLLSSRKMLEERLLEELQYLVGEEGEIRETSFEVVQKDGLLQVTLFAECYEDIATRVEGTYRQPMGEGE